MYKIRTRQLGKEKLNEKKTTRMFLLLQQVKCMKNIQLRADNLTDGVCTLWREIYSLCAEINKPVSFCCSDRVWIIHLIPDSLLRLNFVISKLNSRVGHVEREDLFYWKYKRRKIFLYKQTACYSLFLSIYWNVQN